jgi:UDP-GlcNAc:undecaprenyl-phosphate GlcNAc-1-phosphate transferase
VAALVAFVVAIAATPLAARLAVSLGVVDRPGPLKVHSRPVPYLGGTAVFAAVVALVGEFEAWWIVPLAGALVLGVADDAREVPPAIRLAAEVAVGVAAGLAAPAPGPAGVVLTAVAVVGLVNAVNLLDGLDGLAAGVAAVSAFAFALLGGDGRPLALALGGGLAGFLVFNRPPARIYLGDGGAYLVGTGLAMLAARALHVGDGAGWVVAPLLVAVPVTDTAVAIVRRRRAGRPLFAGDRSHLYDQLVDRGRSVWQTVLAFVALQVAVAAVGVALWHAPLAAAVAVAAVLVAVLGALVLRLGFLDPQVTR